MNKTLLILIAFSVLVFSFACSKKFDQTTPDPLPEEEVIDKPDSFVDKSVKASIQGRVLNEDGVPLAGASVEAGQNTTTTDEHGIFTFKDIHTGQQFGMVKAETQGYLIGSRSIQAEEGSNIFVEIQLIKKILKGVYESGNRVDVNLTESTSVTFEDLTVVTETGDSYAGKVSIYGDVLDPTSEAFTRVLPGNMLGVRTNSSITGLSNYGILNLIMEGEGGEKLQLAAGKAASIKMSISEGIRPAAPETISMWHFDEVRGFWREDGTAIRNGDYYEATVTHFSSWGFSVAEDYVEVSMKIVNDEQGAVPYSCVRLHDSKRKFVTFAYADIKGEVKMLALKSTNLIMDIAGHCNQILLSKDIGTFDGNKDIGIITVPTLTQAVVSGRVVDVDGHVITKGIVRGRFAGMTYVGIIVEGVYQFSIDICDPASQVVLIEAQDSTTGMLSEAVQIKLTQGLNAIGEIKILLPKPIEEYVKYTFDGATREFIPGEDTLLIDFWENHANINFLQDRIYPTQWADMLLIDIPDSVVSSNLRTGDVMCNLRPERWYKAADSSVSVTITKYGKLYEAIEGHFEGNLYRWAGDTTINNVLPITGEFRIRRRRPRS